MKLLRVKKYEDKIYEERKNFKDSHIWRFRRIMAD